jgi:hypothetical protein
MTKAKSAGPRAYTNLTLKRLFGLIANQCSYPGCFEKLLSSEKDINISNICHIAGANKNGQRYDSLMDDKERAGYDNLIILCANHHIKTNDETKYTVDVLKKMKANHEKEVSKKITSGSKMNKYPTLLGNLIFRFSEIDMEEYTATEVKNPFPPDKKIAYNHLDRHRTTMEEYRVYQGRLNSVYAEIEKEGGFKKVAFFHNIKGLYIRSKNELLNKDLSIENIRKHSDDIIDKVESYLWETLESSVNFDDSIPLEVTSMGIKIILVDAFLRCKILEEPRK